MRLKNWWLRQTRNHQILLAAGSAAIILGIWLQNASWFLSWQFYNAYSSGGYQTFDITQTHKFCGALNGVYPNALTASDCSSANNWSTILTLMFWAGLVTLVVIGVKIRRKRSNPPEPPSEGRHVGSQPPDQASDDTHPYPTQTYTSYSYPRHGRSKTGAVRP